MFEARIADNVHELHDELQSGMYQPRPVRRTEIPKPGSRDKRPLGIPTVTAYCTSFNKRSE